MHDSKDNLLAALLRLAAIEVARGIAGAYCCVTGQTYDCCESFDYSSQLPPEQHIAKACRVSGFSREKESPWVRCAIKFHPIQFCQPPPLYQLFH